MIKVFYVEAVEVDEPIEDTELFESYESPCLVIVARSTIYLHNDDWLGLSDEDLIRWELRKDYTGSHLPHYLNYFMVHLVDGYLQTGEY